MGLIPEWIKRGPGDGGQSTNSQAMAQTHQSQPATQSIAGPTMANIAAAGGSRSDTQQVNLNPGPIDATSEIIVQGGSDDVFKHNAELQYKIQELQRQLAAKWNSSALETNALRSEVDKLTKELKEAKAVNKDNLHLYRNHMTQMQEKLNLQMQTIQQQDQDIDFLQTNIDMLEHNHNIELLDSNSGLEHNAQLVSSLKEQLNNATAKNRSLEDSLEECKERIFKLQPFEAKSDTDIASIYETLCDNISAWVADMFDAFGETGEMSNGMAALVADSELRKTEPSALGNGMVLLVKAHPVTDEVVLSSLIIRLLYRKVFGTKDLCFGLDTSTQNFLLRIMKEFSHLEPSKDHEMIEMWRVDTYRALSAIPLIKKKQEGLKEDCVIKLLGCLGAIAPGSTGKAGVDACRHAVDESTSLAHEMRLTTAEYRWAAFDDKGSEPKLLRGHEMQKYKLMDVRTGQVLKRSVIKDDDEETVIGEKLCVIFPALIRKGVKGGKEVTLAKETILVRIYDEFRQQKQKRTQDGGSPSKG